MNVGDLVRVVAESDIDESLRFRIGQIGKIISVDGDYAEFKMRVEFGTEDPRGYMNYPFKEDELELVYSV